MDITCDNCGGRDFYLQDGAYFCSECQVQSQDFREIVYDQLNDTFQDGARKTIKKAKKDEKSKDDKVTTWEVFNYVLLGLTEELIKLGARPCLKPVVRIIWLKYLEKMEVFHPKKIILPKLQTLSTIDAEVIYGYTPRKRKRKPSSSSTKSVDVSTLSVKSYKRHRALKKIAFVKAAYKQSQATSEAASTNSQAVSLENLTSNSENKPKITYNIYASRAIRKVMSRKHLKMHNEDHLGELDCHRLKKSHIAGKYCESPAYLTPIKLYTFLCIGLKIIGDKIQTADLLNFIEDGHLSFRYYYHLLPEHYSKKVLSIPKVQNSNMVNTKLSRYTWEMINFLKLGKFIPKIDLIKLCKRYCTELNLSNEIFLCSKEIIQRTKPNAAVIKFTKGFVPTYEVRVLSIIIFVLKFFFGLDGVTEYKLSNYTNILNVSNAVQPKFFNIIEWLKHIEYRNEVIKEHFFPAQFYQKGNMENVNLLLNYLDAHDYRRTENFDDKLRFHSFLNNLKRFHREREKIKPMPSSLTPYRTYLNELKDNLPNYYNFNLLLKDFEPLSMSHIIKSYKFLDILMKERNIKTHNGGANENWHLHECIFVPYTSQKDKKKSLIVKIRRKPKKQVKETNCGNVIGLKKSFAVENERKFETTAKYIKLRKRTPYDTNKIAEDLKNKPQVYFNHYNPFERYWIYGVFSSYKWTTDMAKDFIDKSPNNLRLILNECLRISKDEAHYFLPQFILTETYLCFKFNEELKRNKKDSEKRKVKYDSKNIEKGWEKYLKTAEKFW